MITFLYIFGILAALLYKTLDYFGFWDRIFGINRAQDAISRLRSGKAFPETFIYNFDNDKLYFNSLIRLIANYTATIVIKDRIKKDGFPGLIVTVGEPIEMNGINPNWGIEYSRFYSDSHPVMVVFGVSKENDKGQGYVCGTIGDLSRWVDRERRNRDYWVGTFVISIYSIASILWRLDYLAGV